MADSVRPRVFRPLVAGEKIPRAIVLDAADWVVRMQDRPRPEEVAACQVWRSSHPLHELAWQRLTAMGEQIHAETAPVAELAGKVLTHSGVKQPARRQALKTLAVLGGVGWLGWQAYTHPARHRWMADASTAVGEQRVIALADGGELILNTASAVDIEYGNTQRRIFLRAGEIMVRTGVDASRRPFVVQTRAGEVAPVGTRFTVRDLDESGPTMRVAVQEGAVELYPNAHPGSHLRVQAGQQARLTPNSASMMSASVDASGAWTSGMLVADQMALGDFLDELARYRHGILRCQPMLAHLPVTGAFPLNDIDRSLAMLTEVLPVRIQRLTPYWVTVAAR